MNCKECQDYLLTDYLDGELSPEKTHQLEAHLSSCPSCREMAESLRGTVVEPFGKCDGALPAETVWQKIKKEITAQEHAPQEDWFKKLKELLFPKPVFALATVACLLLFFVLVQPGLQQHRLAKNTALQQEKAAQSVEYLASLLDEGNNQETYGTAIEEYFL